MSHHQERHESHHNGVSLVHSSDTILLCDHEDSKNCCFLVIESLGIVKHASIIERSCIHRTMESIFPSDVVVIIIIVLSRCRGGEDQ